MLIFKKLVKKILPNFIKSKLKIFKKKILSNIKLRLPIRVVKSRQYLDIRQVNYEQFKFNYYLVDSLVTNSLVLNKPWEPHLTQFVKTYSENFNLRNIVDAGSNFGYHSLLFSQFVNGSVYSFEPQPQNFTLLQKNINLNNTINIFSFEYALSDKDTKSKLPIISNNYQNSNMGNFTINELTSNFYVKIESRLLDSFNFNNIDLIKLDVQGWEKKVLEGSRKTIAEYKPILIVELEDFQLEKANIDSGNLINYLNEIGYDIYFLEYKYPSDHVCVHYDKVDEFHHIFGKYIKKHNENNKFNNNLKHGINKKISFNYE